MGTGGLGYVGPGGLARLRGDWSSWMMVSSLIKLRDRGWGEREVGACEVKWRVSMGKVLRVGACGC